MGWEDSLVKQTFRSEKLLFTRSRICHSRCMVREREWLLVRRCENQEKVLREDATRLPSTKEEGRSLSTHLSFGQPPCVIKEQATTVS